DQRIPNGLHLACGHEQLEAVLTGIAGPRYYRCHAGNSAAADSEERHCGEVDAVDGKHLGGLGALQSHQAHITALVHDLHSGPLVPAEPRHVLFTVCCVDHDPPAAWTTIDDQVVQNSSIRLAEQVVLRLVEPETTQVVGHQRLQEVAGSRAPDLVATHVANVEQAGGGAHRLLLVPHARVLLGHVPTGEVDQTG